MSRSAGALENDHSPAWRSRVLVLRFGRKFSGHEDVPQFRTINHTINLTHKHQLLSQRPKKKMRVKSQPPFCPQALESAASASAHLIIIDFKSPFSKENRTPQTNLELSLTLHLELEMNFICLVLQPASAGKVSKETI